MTLTWGEGAAIVTGGSGGIGSAVVAALVNAGIHVGFTYSSRKEAAARVVRDNEGNVLVKAYPWSTSGAQEAADLVARVTDEIGPVRYLVSCSGIAQTSAFHTLSEDEWRNLIDTNLTATIALARAAVTPMLKAGFGRIILMSSVSGMRGLKGHTVYAATKAAVGGLTRSLAQECAAFNVTVNSIAPGYIETPMLDSMSSDARKKLTKTIPMGRFGAPDEVAQLARYLASDQAGYITGQTLAIDGGISG